MEAATRALMEHFAEAWNRHDSDALMACMPEDCVFTASAGPTVDGTRYAGSERVRAGFIEAWTRYPDARWNGARHFACGERGVSARTSTGTGADGHHVAVDGCDLFTFRDGTIASKDAYRKHRPFLPPH